MKIHGLLVTGICLMLACSSPQQEQQQTDVPQTAAEDQEQTDFDISSIQLADLQGNPVDWETLRGKTVFLNFWATWCKPCIVEMPSMERAYQALKEEDFVVLAASYEEPEKILEFQRKQDFSFPFVHVKNSLESMHIYALPTTFIIGKDGKLAEKVVGARQWDAPEMLEQFRSR